jgi:hypothetical protein
MTTADIFASVCEQYNPHLSVLRPRVLSGDPCELYSPEEERAIHAIILQSLRDLNDARRGDLVRVSRTLTTSRNSDFDDFLGVTGKL